MLTASCMCKAVSMTVEGELEHPPEACHCVECRKQSGSFLMGVNVRKSALAVTGEEHVGWYRSSDKVERGFCRQCGSSLFWKPDLEGYEWIAIAAGVFDQPLGQSLSKHTFVSEKGDYYELADGLPQHEQF